MFNPPCCPWTDCGAHARPTDDFYQRFGSYTVKCRAKPIPRFRCRECRRTFSRQTFRADRFDKRPDVNVDLLKKLVSRTGFRQSARILEMKLDSILAKFKKLGEHLGKLHERLMGTFGDGRRFLLDELETFEDDRILQPVTMPELIDEKSLFFVGSKSGTLPARHTKSTKRRPAPDEKDLAEIEERKNESSQVVREVFDRLAKHLAPGAKLTLVTDKKSTYPGLAKKAFAQQDLTLEAHDGKAPRTTSNPLFPINHTLAMSRDNVSRLTRRSWLCSKKKENLDLHMNYFIAYRNYRRMRTNKDKQTPAQLLGFLERPLKWEEMIGWDPTGFSSSAAFRAALGLTA